MRLKINLNCENGTVLPFNYNYRLVKVISGAFRNASPLTPKRCSGFKLFTFSQLYFDQYNIVEKGIQKMGGVVHWYVTSPRIFFLEGLLRGLKGSGYIRLDSIEMPILDIEVLGDPDIGESMEFSCMSPISLASHSNTPDSKPRYGRIDDHDFEEKLRQELINKYYHVYDALPSDENLTITFNQHYIDKKRRVSRLVDYNGVKILGYMAPFSVTGNPELIRLGYQLGFGHRNSCGFGMVKVWYPNQSGNDYDDEVENVTECVGISQ
mgnify:CR=1 FL=1